MGRITVFTKQRCRFCETVIAVLRNTIAELGPDLDSSGTVGLDLQIIDVTKDVAFANQCKRLSGSHTVPQVFFNEEHVGNCSQCEVFARSGELKRRLVALAATPSADFPPIPDAAIVKISKDVAFSGQPTMQQLRSLGTFGIRSVVCLVHSDEPGFSESESTVLQAQGIAFHHVAPPVPLHIPSGIIAADMIQWLRGASPRIVAMGNPESARPSPAGLEQGSASPCMQPLSLDTPSEGSTASRTPVIGEASQNGAASVSSASPLRGRPVADKFSAGCGGPVELAPAPPLGRSASVPEPEPQPAPAGAPGHARATSLPVAPSAVASPTSPGFSAIPARATSSSCTAASCAKSILARNNNGLGSPPIHPGRPRHSAGGYGGVYCRLSGMATAMQRALNCGGTGSFGLHLGAGPGMPSSPFVSPCETVSECTEERETEVTSAPSTSSMPALSLGESSIPLSSPESSSASAPTSEPVRISPPASLPTSQQRTSPPQRSPPQSGKDVDSDKRDRKQRRSSESALDTVSALVRELKHSSATSPPASDGTSNSSSSDAPTTSSVHQPAATKEEDTIVLGGRSLSELSVRGKHASFTTVTADSSSRLGSSRTLGLNLGMIRADSKKSSGTLSTHEAPASPVANDSTLQAHVPIAAAASPTATTAVISSRSLPRSAATQAGSVPLQQQRGLHTNVHPQPHAANPLLGNLGPSISGRRVVSVGHGHGHAHLAPNRRTSFNSEVGSVFSDDYGSTVEAFEAADDDDLGGRDPLDVTYTPEWATAVLACVRH